MAKIRKKLIDMQDATQLSLGNSEDFKEEWEKEWQDMPEYSQSSDFQPYRTIIIHFKNQDDVDNFEKIIKQRILPKQKSYWHPEAKIRKVSDIRYFDES